MPTDDKNPFDFIFPEPEPQSEGAPEVEPESDEDTLILPKPDLPSAPRIVAETPLGGVVKPRLPGREPEPPVIPPDPEAETIPGELNVSELPINEPPAVVEETTLAEEDATEPVVEPDATTPVEPIAAESVIETEAESPAAEVEETTPAEPVATEPPSRITVSESPAKLLDVPPAAPADWDDDLSPELAAVLFAGPEKREAMPATKPPEAPAAAQPAPVVKPAPEPPADAIMLTDVADVRRLRLTAEQHSAAAPDVSLSGKVRYVRVEEPYKNDQGQRTAESWEYFKPDYPAQEGRLVRKVEVEEIAYADGSWSWRFEREYDDKGRDRRTVRANSDRTFIERVDEVSKRDAETGKNLRFKEEAALIFAAPPKEEKGGFLSKLFGGDGDEPTGPKSWRAASSSEAKQARKQGGSAF